ncbi:hypothetical protein HYDPIDRAFT_43490 [Hydnomerulius pinastri MD-312]|uniref:Uncharacterized protein n=1 Tax=Hydnomerulius pinastri MD-312 TaxID=994086 RepID=A0A0C9WA34_9AGAM|nr:hypothetical protein HYDPIDRAFT_43490 [Hydnomerulius pinastri MD-312]
MLTQSLRHWLHRHTDNAPPASSSLDDTTSAYEDHEEDHEDHEDNLDEEDLDDPEDPLCASHTYLPTRFTDLGPDYFFGFGVVNHALGFDTNSWIGTALKPAQDAFPTWVDAVNAAYGA